MGVVLIFLFHTQTNERREYTYMVELDCIARHRRTKLALQARAKHARLSINTAIRLLASTAP